LSGAPDNISNKSVPPAADVMPGEVYVGGTPTLEIVTEDIPGDVIEGKDGVAGGTAVIDRELGSLSGKSPIVQ
jgi:hypothetical protein